MQAETESGGVGPSTASETDFVGRDRELAELRAGLEEAASGRGRLFLVSGEPGIGKSRLAEDFAMYAERRGFLALWGRCWAGGGAPAFWPWVQVVRSSMEGAEEQELHSRLRLGAENLVHLVPELRERLPGCLPPELPAEPEQARFLLFDAATTFLRSTASARPVALFLDDLQWADSPSLLLLQYLAGNLGRSRLLVVGIYRNVEARRSERVAKVLGALARHATEMPLRGLSVAETKTLVERSGWASPLGSVAELLHRSTGGNPLYVGQVVRLLLAEGARDRRGGLAIGRTAIPDGVREVLRSHVALASPECRELLGAASVLGRGFAVTPLARLCRLPAERVIALVGEAQTLGILAPGTAPVGPLGFAHDLMRETVYDDLAPGARLELHRLAAETLEKLHEDALEAHVAEVAHHLFHALPTADLEKAIFFATAAGDRAMRHFAWEEATGHYERAVEALGLREQGDERLRCELLLKLGEALWSAGEFEKSRDVYLAAADIAERLDMREELARAALGVGGQFPNFGIANADEVLVTVISKAVHKLDPGSPLRALLIGRGASALALTVAWEQAAWVGETALEMARRCGDRRTLAYVLAASLNATWSPDNLGERLARAEELIRLARGLRENRLATDGHTFRLSYLLERADAEAVERELREIDGLLEALPQPYVRWVVTTCRAMRALYEGRLAEAEALAQEALEVGQEGQNTNAALAFAGQFFYVRWTQGRLDEMLGAIEGMLAHYPAMPIWRAALAWVYAELDRKADAQAELERIAENRFAALPRDMTWLFTMSTIAEVVSIVDDAGRAKILYDLLLPYEDRCPVASFTIFTGSIARWLGLLATTLGRFDRAADHFERGLEVNRRMRARPWVACTERDYARMLVLRDAPGDRPRAAELLRRATATARELGMAALLRRAEADLERAGSADEAATESSEPRPSRPAVEGSLQREGDYWAVSFEAKSFRLHDAKGLAYLAALLASPACDIPAVELVAACQPPPSRPALRGESLRVSAGGDAGPVLDARAKAEYRRRLEDLRSDLEEAEGFNDTGREGRIRAEIDALTCELAGAVGLGGRDRRVGAAAERARQSIAQAVKRIVERIARHSPALAEHIRRNVQIGVLCSYRPDPVAEVRWRL